MVSSPKYSGVAEWVISDVLVCACVTLLSVVLVEPSAVVGDGTAAFASGTIERSRRPSIRAHRRLRLEEYPHTRHLVSRSAGANCSAAQTGSPRGSGPPFYDLRVEALRRLFKICRQQWLRSTGMAQTPERAGLGSKPTFVAGAWAR